MSSRKGGGQHYSGGNSKSSPRGKGIQEVSNPGVDQLNHAVGDMTLDSTEDGGWEVATRKSRNKAGSTVAKPWVPQNSNPKAWGSQDAQKGGFRGNSGSAKGPSNGCAAPTGDLRGPAGRGNTRNIPLNRGPENNYRVVPNAIPPPLDRGWNWNARPGSTQPSEAGPVKGDEMPIAHPIDVEDLKTGEAEDDNDEVDYSDDELVSDDYDSDESQKSHETRKKSRWFVNFFETLDEMPVEQINEPGRQWHCPACKNGPGSIDWYRSLQSLITHAKTKGSKRVKLHRELAELLDEELRRKGASAVPAGEAFGKWKGLNETVIDKEIVWPPMVVIMNTKLEKDENDKWIGMGNQELVEYFSSYAAVRARHSYGPQGHRGMSVLIFEASAVGYLEAERLSKHFEDEGTHRDAWERRPVLFYPGGKRQLYGYMADNQDLDNFNLHSQGKSKLRFEMRSYQEMVVNQMKQMSEDNQQLIWFKNRVAKEQKHSKALEESFGLVSEKLRKTMEENLIVRQRTKVHHQQNKEEMDFQEQFFKDQIQIIHDTRGAKEDNFEKMQQEELEKVKQSCENPSSVEDPRHRAEKLEEFIQFQNKEMDEYVQEREKLIQAHKVKVLELEEELNAALTQLMEKYTPRHSVGLSEEGKSNGL